MGHEGLVKVLLVLGSAGKGGEGWWFVATQEAGQSSSSKPTKLVDQQAGLCAANRRRRQQLAGVCVRHKLVHHQRLKESDELLTGRGSSWTLGCSTAPNHHSRQHPLAPSPSPPVALPPAQRKTSRPADSRPAAQHPQHTSSPPSPYPPPTSYSECSPASSRHTRVGTRP